MYLITYNKVKYKVVCNEELNKSHIWKCTWTAWHMLIWIIWNYQYFNGLTSQMAILYDSKQ